MSRGNYQVEMEVAGPAAMFTRPDTGSTPISYPVPTWSAAKGIFESIAYFADGRAWICPTKAQVCRPIDEAGGKVHFQRYTTNYGGPLRKQSLFGKGTAPGGSSMQVFATVITDVCFRLHGMVIGPRSSNGHNPRHHLKDLFDRRLKRGQCFRTPCLGWREFTCSYWGPFRDGLEDRPLATEVDDAFKLDVPSMLLSVWDQPTDAQQYQPTYRQDVQITAGELEYVVPPEWLNGTERKG